MKLNYFNFKLFKNKILITNDFGRYAFVSPEDFRNIVSKKISPSSALYNELEEKNFIYNETDLSFSYSKRYELRNAKSHLAAATALHIFVVTTACNMKCIYCQANNGRERPHLFMTEEIAEKSVDTALCSPAKYLSFEFQGGEPLLNFDIIKHIVLYTEEHKGNHEIDYNVVTNLTLITDDMIDFFKKYNFGISTSIDGPENIHNTNRPFLNLQGTFSTVKASVEKIRAAGLRVGAIETTTRNSLSYPEEIVHAYKEMGFDTIFLRPLTPLGKATVSWDKIGYTPEEFLEFYKRAADEIIKINRTGTFLKENHAAILLARIKGKNVNYMELRSPCGASVGQIAYYPDGNIFTCDEGRMLYEMGYDTFCLGNVFTSSYTDLINTGVCRTVCRASILESVPSCSDCVYQPYCGTCPVVNYAAENDVISKSPHGYRCKIYSGILDYLFEKLLENDIGTTDILNSWSN